MTTRKPLILALGAALVGSALMSAPAVASPGNDAHADLKQTVKSKVCLAALKKITGAYDITSSGKTILVQPGKPVTFHFTVSKGCNTKVSAKLGKKTVASVRFKNAKAKLKIPGSKLKATKKYSYTLLHGTSKLEGTIWAIKGSVSTTSPAIDAYLDNDVPVTASVLWKGPVDNYPYLYFGKGANPTKNRGDRMTSVSLSGTLKSGKTLSTTKWLSVKYDLKDLGLHQVKVDFAWSSSATKPTFRTNVAINVLSNVLEGPTMLAPGTYRWPAGSGDSCWVEVYGTSPERGVLGYKYFTKSDGTTTTGVQVLPTDTKVVFERCGGGPALVG